MIRGFKAIVLSAVLAAATGCHVGAALGEDIDIYSGNTAVTPGAPNVLIVLDNSANWSQSFASSTKFAAEMAALQQVVGALTTQFNLGVMFYVETGSPNNNIDGGYVRFAVQSMSNSDGSATTARNCLLKMVGSGTATCTSANPYYSLFDINADKSNGGAIGLTMDEAYRYYAGTTARSGDLKIKADPLAFTSGSYVGPTYKSPVASGSCQKNFIIVISNGPFQDNTSGTSTAMSDLGSFGGDTTIINPPDTTSNNNAGDEWTRFLNKVSTVNAVTYTLEVGPATTGQGPYNTALLKSMGNQGKGGYYSAIDAATLNAALTRIFNDIQAVNSVFASSSLPLSADNSGAYANQVYMGVFRPDAQGGPRWLGNLKEYQFAADVNGVLSLVDSQGQPAAGSSGFAQPNAISFWTSINTSVAPDAPTPTGTGGFWFFDPKGAGGPYDSPDGEWVEKGGAAQQLRLAYLGWAGIKGVNDSTAPRNVYTCAGGCASSGVALSANPFNVGNTAITDAMLGTATISVTSITGAAAVNVSKLYAGTRVAISSAVTSSGTTTVTTAVANSYAINQKVYFAGTGVSNFDGNACTINGVTSSTVFTCTGITGNKTASTGTVTAPSTTATVTTATAHGFVAGQRITIAGASPSATFNGVVTVANVSSSTAFTYTIPTAYGLDATGTIKATSNTATAVAASHGFTNGQVVTIAGATPSGYNVTAAVQVVDANTFTYVYAVAAPLATATGTITASIGGGRTTLINWVRGLDTQDENGANGTVDVRPPIHGDVLHSRPVVLNYGTPSTSNNVYVFYGGNDGAFHAIKGGQATTDGTEQWAFIPQEFFGRLLRLYNDSPTVLYPSTPSSLIPSPTGTCNTATTTCAARRDYFWDGPVTSYVQRDSTGAVTKAYLYMAVRRGGRFIYAIDVTSPTNPKFLWKRGCPSMTSDTGCDAGFAELGETWSAPQVIKIRANTNPVLIFGAGYDASSEDPEPPAATDTKGRGIYVLDAFTGNIVWSAGNSAMSPTVTVSGMNFSIASDVLTMDRSLDGYADRAYAVDVGGNVWRIDLADSLSNWAVWEIATLGSRSATATTRKFLFSPDVVFGTTYDSVVVGSGDREHPLATNQAYGTVNRVYALKDPNTGITGAALGLTDTCGATVTTSCTNLYDTANGTTIPPDANGWLMTLPNPGEEVVNGPIVVAGNMIFGTNQACVSGYLNSDGSCGTASTGTLTCTGNLGVARRYDISYQNAASIYYTNSSGTYVPSQIATGGGFLPSPVAGVVEIGGKDYVFVTDNPLNPGGVLQPTINVSTKRYREYWKEKLN